MKDKELQEIKNDDTFQELWKWTTRQKELIEEHMKGAEMDSESENFYNRKPDLYAEILLAGKQQRDHLFEKLANEKIAD